MATTNSATLNPSNPPGFLIQQGLSDKAADAANQQTQQSIQSARDSYTKGTNSAIDQLFQSYGSAFNLQAPQIQQGGYAGAKLNYLLGLPPASLPDAPVKTPGMSDQQFKQNQDQYNILNPVAKYGQNLGTATAGDIQGIVSNLPGFLAQMNQGTQAIQNSASASGMLNSGNILTELQKFGMGMQSDYYNNYIKQLSDEAAVGNNASNNVAGQNVQQGQTIAGLQSDLGTNMANADLASGQASSQGILSKLSSYNNRYVPTIPQQTQPSGNSLISTNPDLNYGQPVTSGLRQSPVPTSGGAIGSNLGTFTQTPTYKW